MKSLSQLTLNRPVPTPPLQERSGKESLISQIVERTNAKDKKALAKRIALWANRYHLTETDLHALLKKKDDPSIRNFSAFVQWSIKDNSK